MNINKLVKIIEKKILSQDCITKVKIEDKSFLHKNHITNKEGKFHIKLTIDSEKLKKKNKIEANRFIYKILDQEIKTYIHSLQIVFI